MVKFKKMVKVASTDLINERFTWMITYLGKQVVETNQFEHVSNQRLGMYH